MLDEGQAMLSHASVQIRSPVTETTFTSHLFPGRADEWSLAPLLADSRDGQCIRKKLGETLQEVGATDVYAPSPTAFNAVALAPSEMQMVWLETDHNIRAYRTAGKPADVTWLEERGCAYAFSGAGCSLVVIESCGFLFAAHGGRDSVLDRARVQSMGKERSRDHEGIVESIFTKIQPNHQQLRETQVYVFWSIPWQSFGHPLTHERYGSYNRSLVAHTERWQRIDSNCVRVANDVVHLDIPRIIRAQCIEIGVPRSNIDLDNARLPKEIAHTRNNSNGKRYLAAVVRH